MIGYVDLVIHPLRTDLRRLQINSKQCRIYRVCINEVWEAAFWYNDPTMEICQGQGDTKQRNLERFEMAHNSAMNAVDPDSGNGEVTIRLPPDCFQIIGELQPFHISVEFSLEHPKGGLHFVVPNMEGSLVERGAHMFSYRHENSSRLWFPCVDSFSEPCTWKLEFTVDLEMTAISCGDLIEVVYTPDRRRKTYHYFLSSPTSAPNIALAVGPFEMLVDPNMHEVTHFCLPHLKGILKHTTSYTHEAFEFYEELMSSRYPFNCYKQVFVDESYEDVTAYATMAIFSTSLLHSSRIIDQTMVSRKLMASAVAQQFFSCFITMQSWCDAWLPKGIAAYLAHIFVKKTFGNNEYRHVIAQYAKDVEEYEIRHGGIVLDPSKQESFGLYFSTLQPHTISPAYLDMYHRKALLIVRMLELRLGPTLLLQVFNKLLALAFTASQQKFAANSWSNMLLSTNSFLKIISTVTGKDIQPFIDQWVFQSGCARFVGSFVFNRKRNVVELEIKQDAATSGAFKYVGPLDVTIQELDGSFNHTFMIEENKTKFEITCHSKSRRNKKKKIPLITGEEVDMDLSAMDADSPVLWLRIDPLMNLLRNITWEQPDYMWQYQLKYERDVIAQSEAIQALRQYQSPSTRKALTDILENEQCFYKVRIEASMCLAKIANSMVSSWAGPPAMMNIFRKMFGSHSCPSIIRQNNFNNFQHYFIQKAIPIAMATLRNVHNICPPEVVRFLLDLFKYNDNTKNKYSDNYYRAALIDAVAATVTPAVTTVTITGQSINADMSSDMKLILEEVTRCLNLEKLLPCYRHTITVSCLRAIRTLQKFGHLPSDASIFRSYAHHGVFQDIRVVAIEALVDFIKTDVNVAELYWLLDVVERDPDTFVRHKALEMLCQNPPFRRGEESLLNTEALVNRLWKLMNSSLSHDSRLRCGVADFYFVLFGRYRPSCLARQDSATMFTIREKKPMLNPAIVSEQMQEMFDDDEEDGIDLPSNVRSTQRVTMTPPPPPKREIEDVVFVDVEGNPSETESPQAGTKRKAESPPHVPVPQVVSVSVPTIRSASVEEDSNPVKLKIKEDKIPVPTPKPEPISRLISAPEPSSRPSGISEPLMRGTSVPESLSRVMSMGGDSMSRLSEDSNSSVDSSSVSMSRSYLSNSGKTTEGLTSFQGLFSKASSGPSSEPPAMATAAADDSASKHHRLKKKKKKNKHKHKHKHKHERPEKDKWKERQDSFSMPSPMVGSVQSVTSVSSVDATKDSAPSSPEFEII